MEEGRECVRSILGTGTPRTTVVLMVVIELCDIYSKRCRCWRSIEMLVQKWIDRYLGH